MDELLSEMEQLNDLAERLNTEPIIAEAHVVEEESSKRSVPYNRQLPEYGKIRQKRKKD